MTEHSKALRLAEELDEFAELVHGASAQEFIASAASLIRAQQEEIERLRTICTGTARAVLATPSRVLFCDNCEWDEGDGELFQCPSCIARQYDADEGAALTEEK
jgi:hypothetical protein